MDLVVRDLLAGRVVPDVFFEPGRSDLVRRLRVANIGQGLVVNVHASCTFVSDLPVTISFIDLRLDRLAALLVRISWRSSLRRNNLRVPGGRVRRIYGRQLPYCEPAMGAAGAVGFGAV